MAKPARLLSQLVALLSLAAASSPALAQGRLLRGTLDLEAGQTYFLRTAFRDEITYPTDGNPWVATNDTDLELSFRVLSVDAVGTARVEVKYERVSVRFDNPNRVAEFHSGQPPEAIHEDVAPYSGLVGLGYSVQISAQGTAFGFQGMDEMLDALLDRIQLPEEMKAARRREYEQDFGERAQREWLEIALGYLPNRDVRPGGEWQKEAVLSLGYPVTLNNRFVFVGREDGRVSLKMTGDLTPAESVPPMISDDSELTATITGTQDGSYLIDEATGWIREATLAQELAGTVLVEGPPGTEPYILPFSARTESRVNGTIGQSYGEAVAVDPAQGRREAPRTGNPPGSTSAAEVEEMIRQLEALSKAGEARDTTSAEAMADRRVADLNAATDALYDAYGKAREEYAQAGQLLISPDEEVLKSANAPAAKALFEASLARLDDLVQNNRALAQEDMVIPSLEVDILRFRDLDGLRAIARMQDDGTGIRVNIQRLIELGSSMMSAYEEAMGNPEITLATEYQQLFGGIPPYIADAHADLAWVYYEQGDFASARRYLAEAERRGADQSKTGTLRLLLGR